MASQLPLFFALLSLKALTSCHGFIISHSDYNVAFNSHSERICLPISRSPERRASTRLFGSSKPRWQPQAPQEEKPKKKQKKNKYSNFSKVEVQEKDPLEQMIAESENKLTELEKEQANALKRGPDADIDFDSLPAPKKMLFPTDTSSIDPYDPSTFGYVEIATVLNPHGVRGWMRVQARTDFPDRLTKPGTTLHIKLPRKRAPRRVVLACGKDVGNEEFLIQLQDTYDRDSAQKWQGATVYYATQQDDLVGVDGNDDYLVTDLVSFEVLLIEEEDMEGKKSKPAIGSIVGIVLAEEICDIPGLGQDMLEVELKRDGPSKTYGEPENLVMIPMVPELVPIVDMDRRQVHIDPPPGLLDLTYEREEKIIIKGLLPEKSSFGM